MSANKAALVFPPPANVDPLKTTPSLTGASAPLSGRELDKLEKARPVQDGYTRRSLRIAIVTENFLPSEFQLYLLDLISGTGLRNKKDALTLTLLRILPEVDGVTRTLAMLLEHLQKEGHEALVLGPNSGMSSYAGHEVVGTKGLPLLGVYKGLALNFIRPRFIRKLRQFKPDVIQFIDPIWLCAQVIPIVQFYFPTTPLLTSYHTNLAMYATLFGFSWLTPVMWNLQRNLHGRCSLTYCPSPSTQRMLNKQGFENVRLWPRGVYTNLFRPEARDDALRASWQAESKVVLLYVGRISWEKNLRLLVESARGLQIASEDGKRPACQLVFVGEGPSRKELETLCDSYQLNAIFMGYRKGAELAACFASADIFAFPSWTETFGQVVLESLASGLPVVGLRAEGVCDLVQHGQTGLLLDLDGLIPSTTAEREFSSSAPPEYTEFRPLPANPHLLVDSNAPTFPLAVSMYRNLLVELVSDEIKRKAMGKAAALDASTKTWHDAMELLVDGYRELVTKKQESQENLSRCSSSSRLTLSRTSTIELDIVCEDQKNDSAETTAAVPRNKNLLRLGGVFRRTGGKFRENSFSVPRIRTWLGRSEPEMVTQSEGGTNVQLKGESVGSMWATRMVIKLLLISYAFFILSTWLLKFDKLSQILA